MNTEESEIELHTTIVHMGATLNQMYQEQLDKLSWNSVNNAKRLELQEKLRKSSERVRKSNLWIIQKTGRVAR